MMWKKQVSIIQLKITTDYLKNKRIMFICCELLVHVSIGYNSVFGSNVGSCYDNHIIHCSHYYFCRFLLLPFYIYIPLSIHCVRCFLSTTLQYMLTNYSSAVINNSFPYEAYFIPCFMTCIRLNNHKEIGTRLLSPLK